MKTIFKTILLATALLLTANVAAQDSPIQFGVKAGVNLSNFGGDVDGNKAKIGFLGGVTLDYAFTPDWYLMTGLEFTMKGAKWDGEDGSTKISYLQLPIHAGYKLLVADNTKIVFHAGPYLAYGLSAKEEGVDLFKKYDGLDKAALKRFDFGVGLGVGAEFGKIGVGIGYDFGLANISNYDEAKLRNQNAYLTVGYKF